jgi:hypothetical protein
MHGDKKWEVFHSNYPVHNTHKMAAETAPTDHIKNLFKTITDAGSSTKEDIQSKGLFEEHITSHIFVSIKPSQCCSYSDCPNLFKFIAPLSAFTTLTVHRGWKQVKN